MKWQTGIFWYAVMNIVQLRLEKEISARNTPSISPIQDRINGLIRQSFDSLMRSREISELLGTKTDTVNLEGFAEIPPPLNSIVSHLSIETIFQKRLGKC